MEMFGIVQGTPTLLENCCIFSLEGEDGLYLILSTDMQAVKDNIFVKQGQEIQILGSILKRDSFKGILVTESAKIKIKKQ